MEEFSIYELIYRCVNSELYAYCDTLDQRHLCTAFEILNSFDIDWIRHFILEKDLDPYTQYWFKRKIILIQSALVVMSQRILHHNKVALIQLLLDCRIG